LKNGGYVGKNAILGIRPEDIYDADAKPELDKKNNIEIHVDVAELMGAETIVYGDVHGQNIVALINLRTGNAAGSTMKLHFDMDAYHFFDAETEGRIK
jgi:multiple sugar transport system ATP-binding protein